MSLGAALIDALTEDDLEVLASRLRPFITPSDPDSRPRATWLTTKQAASHLGLSVHALHKLTARREIPFEQDGPGCRLWFEAAELDRWRRGQISTPAAARRRFHDASQRDET